MNLLDLFVKVGVKDEASENVETLSGKFKNGLAAAAKVGAAAVGAAATGIAVLTKNALNNYAEYEQLVGGVDTLFKDSSAKVQKYAENAYKTAGLSANEYMDTVTSFSASLLQSLGGDTETAAEMANVAITDMSDNANKMGTDMTSIQNAYQGFAKQNYTMLDNLKLGYGGTKEEMQRLIDDANALNAAQGNLTDYSIDSYADIVSAIHDVQTEMGITGTTAKEASTTIQGSVLSMKSAWGNLLVGIADDNADFKTLTEQFVDSLVTVGENIIPRINVILGGISQLVTSASTTIIPMVITTITDNLPALLQSAVALVGTLGQGIIDSLPAITQAAIDILFFLANGLIDNLPTLIDGIVQVTLTIVQMLTRPDFLTQLIETAILLIMTLANGLIDAIPQLIAAIPLIIGNLIAAIVAELPSIIAMGIDLLFALIDGIIQCIPELVAAIPTLIIAFINGLVNNLDKIILAGPQIIISLITGLIGAIPELIASVPRVIMAIVDTIRNYDWASIGKNIVEGLKNGIANMWSNIKNWFKDKVNGLVGGIKDALGIHSPSKVFAGIGENMALGLGQGWEDEIDGVTGEVTKTLDFNAGITAAPVEAGNNAIVMLLSKYLPLLANMQVVLSDGTLVGTLAPELNAELARINALEDRAV